MSQIIEEKEYFGKILVHHFHIEEVVYNLKYGNFKSTKWLNVQDWEEIYQKLDHLIVKSFSENFKDFENDEFIASNYIQVRVEKANFDKRYLLFFGSENDRKFVPVVMIIHISKIKADELLKKAEEKESDVVKRCDSGIDNGHSNNFHEYDPVKDGKGNQASLEKIIPYKASKVVLSEYSESSEANLESQAYSPKPIEVPIDDSSQEKKIDSSQSAIPPYKPSKISQSKDQVHHHVDSPIHEVSYKPFKSFRREREYKPTQDDSHEKSHKSKSSTSKSSREEDLFGSDDSDAEAKVNKDTVTPRKCRPTILVDLESPDCKGFSDDKNKHSPLSDGDDWNPKRKRTDGLRKKSPTLDNWLSTKTKPTDKESSRDRDRSELKKSSKSSKSKKSKREQPRKKDSTKISIPVKSTPAKQISPENEDKVVEETVKLLEKMRENINKNIQKPPVEGSLRLDHYTAEELISTFSDYKPMFDKIFDDFKKSKCRQVVRALNGADYVSSSTVVGEDKCVSMLNSLGDHYEIVLPSGARIELLELFMKQMLPEWVTALFMKEYNMSQEDSIKQIKNQDVFNVKQDLSESEMF